MSHGAYQKTAQKNKIIPLIGNIKFSLKGILKQVFPLIYGEYMESI